MTNADEAKGRIKEATGAIKGDHDLKQQGRVDQASGRIKEAAGDARAAIDDARDRVADAIHHRK
jgi:uncharacterized protein YjbJ (UPF0337 family)